MKAPILLFCVFDCLTAIAQTVPTTIRVTSETVPAGGMAQMKVLLTSPMPITSGNMAVDMSGVSFDSIDGIALFSGTGDVGGAAVVNGGLVNVQFTSPNGTFGTGTDYPLLTVALTVSKNTFAGQKFPVNLDPTASIWRDLLGSSIPFEFQQGSITVGGSVSITNVVPGGGTLPAGGRFSIFGLGFSPLTKVSVRGLAASSIQYVSPTEFRLTVKDGGILDGTLIQVENPDKSLDTYYSYMRGVSAGQSAQPLLSRTVPVFSINTAFEAVLSPTISSDYFTAIALQNPSPVSTDITIESRSAAGAVTASMNLTLPSGYRITREVSELFGATLPTGGYLHVLSKQAIQMLGLLGNERTGVVLSLSVNVLSAPAPPPAPVPTPSGGGGGKGK
jgi:hypothetical protein